MNPRYKKVAIPILFLVLGLAIASVAIPLVGAWGNGDSRFETISGNGTIYNPSGLHAIYTPLTSCNMAITINASEVFTGLITTNTPGGVYAGLSHGVDDECVTPFQSEITFTWTLSNVTVTDPATNHTIRGGIILQVDANNYAPGMPGGYNKYVITVLGGWGGLAGVTGHGVAISGGTASNPTLKAYWMELTIEHGHQ